MLYHLCFCCQLVQQDFCYWTIYTVVMERHFNLSINGHSLAATLRDTKSKNIVIFCHGYRSSSIGPQRLFVDCARNLAKYKISSVRFDQYGSGNSEGAFVDSGFNDWVETARLIAQKYLSEGYKVMLFGQSMGGATVIAAAADLPDLAGLVAWVPDPSVDKFTPPPNGIIEEEGQIIKSSYWQEAHDAGIALKLNKIDTPCYIVQASDDRYVSHENHTAIVSNAQENHAVDMHDGYSHSSWSYAQIKVVMPKTIGFVVQTFAGTGHLDNATDVIKYLRKNYIDPILYGSLGLSLYLGDFKKFDDIDLLVKDEWLHKKWPKLVETMKSFGFKLIDEHEHEFVNQSGSKVAFAEESILTRDGISEDFNNDVVAKPVNGIMIKTLTLPAFRRAYEFSKQDGYRQKMRDKKDAQAISLIDSHISKYLA